MGELNRDLSKSTYMDNRAILGREKSSALALTMHFMIRSLASLLLGAARNLF
jgi:hypothetical protein